VHTIPHVIAVLPDRNKHVQHDGCNACMMDATPSLKRKWKMDFVSLLLAHVIIGRFNPLLVLGFSKEFWI